jgi:hypothetical protein
MSKPAPPRLLSDAVDKVPAQDEALLAALDGSGDGSGRFGAIDEQSRRKS